MITIICGDRNCNDYDMLERAISQSGFDITMVYSGGARGVDKLGELWAKAHNIPVKIFQAQWDDTKAKNAIIKTRTNPWTHKQEKYNANAGFQRNQDMIDAGAEAVIALQPTAETNGTQDTIKRAKKNGLKIHIYEKSSSEYEYEF